MQQRAATCTWHSLCMHAVQHMRERERSVSAPLGWIHLMRPVCCPTRHTFSAGGCTTRTGRHLQVA
jgi:hypothetical protein